MLNICLLSAVMIFCALGVYFFAKEIISVFTKNTISSKVILEIHNKPNNVESILRSVLSANPESEIIISDKSENREIKEILKKLSDDNSRIHIETAPEQ